MFIEVWRRSLKRPFRCIWLFWEIYLFTFFSDEGFYECQVSTSPPIGHKVQLVVVGHHHWHRHHHWHCHHHHHKHHDILCLTSYSSSWMSPEPQVSIVGGPDLFINQGSIFFSSLKVFLQYSQSISSVPSKYFFSALKVFLQFSESISSVLWKYFFSSLKVFLQYSQSISAVVSKRFFSTLKVFLQFSQSISSVLLKYFCSSLKVFLQYSQSISSVLSKHFFSTYILSYTKYFFITFFCIQSIVEVLFQTEFFWPNYGKTIFGLYFDNISWCVWKF